MSGYMEKCACGAVGFGRLPFDQNFVCTECRQKRAVRIYPKQASQRPSRREIEFEEQSRINRALEKRRRQ